METYQRLPLSLVRGKGCWVWDTKGNRYLDAVAGIAACSIGHSNEALRRSLTKQLNQIQHVSNLYGIPEQEELSGWLTDNSCANKVFFCNSGAEANEAAIKLIRKYGHKKRGIDRPIILTAEASFHGRTLAAVSATGQPKYHKGFEPLVEGFKFFPYNEITYFEECLKQLEINGPKVAAVLIEPLQGEGGVIPGEKSFFKRIKELCNKHEILLVFDEVQTGMGRCGTWWGYEKLSVEPDVFTLAKGLGGGHPIGALLVKDHANVFKAGDHASTFGGNPFACKAALTVAKEIEDKNILKNVNDRSLQLCEGLNVLKRLFPNHIKEVRGWGLIQGLVLQDNSPINAQEFTYAALNQQLLVVAAGPKVVRMVPPLTINKDQIRELIDKLKATLKSISN